MLSLNLLNDTFIIGDFNQDILTSNGDALVQTLENFNFSLFVNNATRISKTSSTLLDVLFSNNKSSIQEVDSISCPFSDHNFIVASCNFKTLSKGAQIIESRILNEKKIRSNSL